MADKRKNSSNFISQAAILGAASIITRLIGIFYRVPLNNILGEKGVAYYGVAYEVYSILLLLSSYSMPLAVSKMISSRVALRQYANTKKIFLLALCFGLCCGIAAFCILYFGAEAFADLLSYPQSVVALRTLSPALIILSVLGVFRGLFQGLGSMVPTAVSNILEQIVNAVVSIWAAVVMFNAASDATGGFSFSNIKEAYGAAGGTLGTVIGALFALLFMIFLYFVYKGTLERNISREGKTERLGSRQIIKILVVTIIPVILSTTIYNLGSIIDTGLFGNIMASLGTSSDLTDTLTGMYTGNYRLIINVPVALASALASSLIPSVVASATLRKKREVVKKTDFALKVTVLIAMPCAAGIGFLAKPIVNLLFPSSTDPDKVSLMLMIGCLSVLFYSISTITNSILQGIDKMRIPVIHSAISLLAHAALLVILLYVTGFDIFCVVVSDMFFALLMCILNQRSLRKYMGFRIEYKRTFIIPAVCSLGMGVSALLIYRLFYMLIHINAICLFIAIIFAVIVYFVFIVLLKGLREDELRMIPGGGKLISAGKKLHLM